MKDFYGNLYPWHSRLQKNHVQHIGIEIANIKKIENMEMSNALSE